MTFNAFAVCQTFLFGLCLFILSPGCLAAEKTLSCVYANKSEESSLALHNDCARWQNGQIVMHPRHIEQLYTNHLGLTAILIDGQFYYYNPKTEAFLPVIAFDNWADNFSDGLVRSSIEGKMAFYDQHFRQVIPPRYDFASPFYSGYAVVCLGCHIDRSPRDHSGCDHHPLVGGLWGYIDKEGNEIVPLSFTPENIDNHAPLIIRKGPFPTMNWPEKF